MAAAYASQAISTRITALVEPPDGDLDLMAREGGCRLILTYSSAHNSVREEKNEAQISKGEQV